MECMLVFSREKEREKWKVSTNDFRASFRRADFKNVFQLNIAMNAQLEYTKTSE